MIQIIGKIFRAYKESLNAISHNLILEIAVDYCINE